MTETKLHFIQKTLTKTKSKFPLKINTNVRVEPTVLIHLEPTVLIHLEPRQGTLRVPGPHFDNNCFTHMRTHTHAHTHTRTHARTHARAHTHKHTHTHTLTHTHTPIELISLFDGLFQNSHTVCSRSYDSVNSFAKVK